MPNSNPACGEIPQKCIYSDIQKLGEMYPSIRVSGVSMLLEFIRGSHWQTSSVPLWYVSCHSETYKWHLLGDDDPYVDESSTGGEFPNLFFPGYTTSAE